MHEKCSADIRDKSAKHWSDESVFSNRAYFLFEKQNELAIQNIKDGDSGIYRCRVDFEVGQTRNSKVNLTVIREYKEYYHTPPYLFRIYFYIFCVVLYFYLLMNLFM